MKRKIRDALILILPIIISLIGYLIIRNKIIIIVGIAISSFCGLVILSRDDIKEFIDMIKELRKK